MREIKFRYRLKNIKTGKIIVKIFTIKEIESHDFSSWFENYEILSRDEYTSKNDKDKKEIYEDDIIKRQYGVGYSSKNYPSFVDGTQRETIIIVEWNETSTGYIGLAKPFDSNFYVEFEIIGNKYENPELLEK